MVILVVVISCAILVGVSYLMLDMLSGIVVTINTPVREINTEGEMFLPLPGKEVVSMQVSGDGRLIAFMEKMEEGVGAVLRVMELSGDHPEIINQVVRGEKLAWLGGSSSLLYEDQGDIRILDVRQGTQANLTAGEEYDRDPLPSPDGRYILWTRSPTGTEFGMAELWVMGFDGSNKALLAPWADPVTWDPAGGKIISRQKYPVSNADRDSFYFLQTAVPGEGKWNYYTECEGEARYIWWPIQDDLFYVFPRQAKGQNTVKGIWYRVEDPETQAKAASTDGLDDDEAHYRFYPARVGERLAYVGEKGLEYLDYEEGVVYRYTALDAGIPLAWNESGDEIYYLGPDGIYRVSLKEG